MTEAAARLLILAVLLVLTPGVRLAWAETLTIGYVELANDERYEPVRGAESMILAARDRPFPGLEVALDDARPVGALAGRSFAMERITVADENDAGPAVLAALRQRGIHFFILDLPAGAVRSMIPSVRGQEVMLFNATAGDDELRRDVCAAELVHTMPSQAMLTDAMMQYLVFRKWNNVLLLQGPRPEDDILAAALTRSAKKFGARIVASAHFKLGTDPREREQNDLSLLTATTRDYDVVFVADTDPDQEFARAAPYRTTRPRPVIGSAGLIAAAWHWTWERYGAPQLNNRFRAKTGHAMADVDWSVWMAARVVTTAAARTPGTEFRTRVARILSDPSFDGVKGLAVSVRPWDHQLRQAILLTTTDVVVAAAPLPGFLHATNELDTLGDDRPESPCQLAKG